VTAAPWVTQDDVTEVTVSPRVGLVGALTSTDNKVIGLMIMGTAFLLFFVFGAMALVMRVQLAQPDQSLVPVHVYNQLFTIHGSGMIYMVITPIALGMGVYLVPLHIGAPGIAAPRSTLFGYWMYVLGAFTMLCGFGVGGGNASAGWFEYTPLSTSTYSPGQGPTLWVVGVFMASIGMIVIGSTTLWTALRLRAPGMTLFRMPLFVWSMIVTNLMVIMAFPSLVAACVMLGIGRMDPGVFAHNMWNITYENLFWFFGHPVVYVMFFPYVGAIDEVIATFAGRPFVDYKFGVFAFLVFAAGSMSVWGHHLLASGQVSTDYFSFTTIFLAIPAGAEYYGFLATLIRGRIRFSAAMLFALAFIPQFLIGGLSGILLGTPVIDYQMNDSFFVVAHFHYTLFAGSFFGFMAAVYFWWPKVTGWMLSERLGKVHFWLLVIGTNATFGPMFALGFMGYPRRIQTYPASTGFGTLSLVATIGAFIIGLAMAVFLVNVVYSARRRVVAPPDPWGGHTLEWATTSPPPRFNYVSLPPITSYAPVWDLREAAGVEP
jgi:cytochrome c oxidase subunit 1